MNFALTAPVLLLFAMVSWRFIEKPILMLRRKFSFQARRIEEDAKAAAESGSGSVVIARQAAEPTA